MRKSIRNVFMAAAAGVSMVALAACGGGDAAQPTPKSPAQKAPTSIRRPSAQLTCPA